MMKYNGSKDKWVKVINNRHILHNLFIILILFIGIASTLFDMSLTLGVDEPFTIGLVQHSFKTIISLDALDVHPPLYYLLLKAFLLITTFWSKSMSIKIIFARIFSLIIFGFVIYFSFRLLKLCSVKINYMGLLAIYILLPVIISRIVNIRMYNLSVLFILIELNELISFKITKRYYYLIIASFFTLCNLYTFYIGALSAILLLFLPFLIKLLKHRYLEAIKLFIPLLLCLILFLPWIPILFNQYISHIRTDDPINVNPVKGVMVAVTQQYDKNIIITMIMFCIIFMCYSLLRVHNNTFNYLLVVVFSDLIITTLITILLCHRNFQPSTIYPIYAIFMMLICTVVIMIFSRKCDNKYFGIAIVFIILLLIPLSDAIPSEMNQYKSQYFQLSSTINDWRRDSDKNIRIYPNINGIKVSSDQFNDAQDALYLSSMHKRAIIQNSSYEYLARGILNDKYNVKLLKRTFNNMKATDQ